MALDTTMQNVANRLLERLGNNVTLEQDTITEETNREWLKDSASTATSVVKAVTENFSLFEKQSDKIEGGDRRYLIDAKDLTLTPKVGDRLLVGSVRHDVVAVDAIGHAPTGLVAVYRVQVRK